MLSHNKIINLFIFKAQISAFNEFKNSAQIVCNTAMELQELLPQLAEFLNKALNK